MKLPLLKCVEAIEDYIDGNILYPFFVVANNSADIAKITDSLPSDFTPVYTSYYCLADDYAGIQDTANNNKFSFTLSGQFLVGTIYNATFFDGDNELNTLRFMLKREKGAPKKKTDGTEFFK